MSQFALKLIAMVAMLLDHCVKALPVSTLLAPFVGIEHAALVRDSMVILGRMAFPMFAWFAAEGCRRTSSLGKYMLRLGVFAVISEIPFQLCFDGGNMSSLTLACHNTMFTLVLAVAAVWAGKVLHQHRVPELVAYIVPAIAAIATGWFLHTDYNAWGVALILGLYYVQERKGQYLWLAAWITVFQLVWRGWNGYILNWLSPSGSIQLLYWLGALIGEALLLSYNDRQGPKMKWLFYGFYPVHLLLLALLRGGI